MTKNICIREDYENMHLKPSESASPTLWFTHLMHFKPCVEFKWQQSFHCYYSLSQPFHVPFIQVRNYLFICKQPPLTLCLQYRRLIRVCLPPPHSQSATEGQRTAGSTEQPWGGHTMGLLHPPQRLPAGHHSGHCKALSLSQKCYVQMRHGKYP